MYLHHQHIVSVIHAQTVRTSVIFLIFFTLFTFHMESKGLKKIPKNMIKSDTNLCVENVSTFLSFYMILRYCKSVKNIQKKSNKYRKITLIVLRV